MKTSATLYMSDGHVVDITPKNGKPFTLEVLQRFVGGYIESLTLDDGRKMIVNEEGKLKGMEVNEKASALLPSYFNDVIVGSAIVCSPNLFQ